MAEWVYKVVDDHGNTIADHMTLENTVILLKLDESNKNNQIFTPNAIKGAMEKWNKEHPDDEMFIDAEGNLAMSSRRFGHIENGIFVQGN